MNKAQIFACLLIGEYLIAAVLFANTSNKWKALYFIGCLVKDFAVIMM